jgi:hypothetical protein
VQSLGDLTGADVAASDDRTGDASQGGDRDLEYKTGNIETPVPFSAIDQATWKAVLAVGNTPPTLTGFASPMGPTNEDTEVAITLGALETQGDEADVDGTVDGFVVKSVSSGTLRIGPDGGSATPFASGTNDTVDATKRAYCTPSAGASGVLDAFEVVARDDDGAESIMPVMVRVTANGDNDPPTDIALSNNTVDVYTDTSGGYPVGTLAATDSDSGGGHSYSILGGANAALFSIANGNELVLTDGVLGFGTRSTYEVTVRVIDSGGLTYDESLTIVVDKTLLPVSEETTAVNKPTTRVRGPEIAVPVPAMAFAPGIPEPAILAVAVNPGLPATEALSTRPCPWRRPLCSPTSFWASWRTCGVRSRTRFVSIRPWLPRRSPPRRVSRRATWYG